MTRTISWVTIVLTAIVGIFFICFFREVNLFSWLVRALGVMLIIPGGVLLFQALSASSVNASATVGGHTHVSSGKAGRYSIVLVSVVAIVMGICMLANPGFFVAILAYVFAAALIVYGVYQVVTVAYYSGGARMPWFYYIVPALTVIIGVIIIFTPVHTMNSIVTLLTGILLLSAAVNWGMQRVMMKKYFRPVISQQKQIEENVD
ncbi:MAG: DUF308 domain-containing protein [Paramuribaculum sp.]|nr:DUF308 domain-containing protein [Paramuribaculum sp.]